MEQSTQKRTNRTLLWMIIALIAVAAAIIVGVLWAVTARKTQAEAEEYRGQLENGYRQSYYELTYSVSNLSDCMTKLSVSNSPVMQMQLLSQVNTHATAAATSLAGLVEGNESAHKTMKYINQVGDYCLSLQANLQQGGRLSQEDKDTLTSLYMVLQQIEQGLDQAKDKLQEDGYAFVDVIGTQEDVFAGLVTQLESTAIAYPSLIYDGPFSDALDDRTVHGVHGEQLTQQQAQQKAATYLPKNASSIQADGTLGGDIECYRFSATVDGQTYYVDVTKQGGMLFGLNSTHMANDTTYQEDECIAVAQAYLDGIGYTDMQSVWISNYDSIYYINFAYMPQDVIMYSDLVVVKVSAQTKAVVGVEAVNYLYNHTTDRTVATPTVDEEAAKGAISAQIKISAARLTLIPTAGGNEKLAWEVSGTGGEDIYFVYVDALTGNEIKIMRVIDSAQGKLLL